MRKVESRLLSILFVLFIPFISSCSSYSSNGGYGYSYYSEEEYASRIPSHIETNGEKVVLVNPNVHVWGAYGADGNLVRAGVATAGAKWCDDTNEPCATSVGTFRVQTLGDGGCISKKFPLPHGGGLMPYCMYFHNGEALHGSPDGTVVEANVSHGCVRMRIQDAEWMRYNFIQAGTKVVVEPY